MLAGCVFQGRSESGAVGILVRGLGVGVIWSGRSLWIQDGAVTWVVVRVVREGRSPVVEVFRLRRRDC